jgi:IclR family acetate operon transcriptional repressor
MAGHLPHVELVTRELDLRVGIIRGDSPIGCVDKALRTLQRLGEVGVAGRSLTRLANDLNLDKTSLYRTLQALSHRGFVEKDVEGNYRLGATIRALAESSLYDEHLRSVVHSGLVELSVETNETCHLGVLVGDQILYVDKVGPPSDQLSAIGGRNQAVSTALGRAILCHKFLDFGSFAAGIASTVSQRTVHTCTSPEGLWRKLVVARTLGFAREDQENEIGFACVAMALLGAGAAVGAVSITLPQERLNESRIPNLIGSLRECIEPHLPPGLLLQRPTHGGERRARYAKNGATFQRCLVPS